MEKALGLGPGRGRCRNEKHGVGCSLMEQEEDAAMSQNSSKIIHPNPISMTATL